MIAYRKSMFVIIYRQEILYARRELNAENLALEKLVMNIPVNISQTFSVAMLAKLFCFNSCILVRHL